MATLASKLTQGPWAKRAGKRAAEHLRWGGGEPGSPSSAYHPMSDTVAFDCYLYLHIHDLISCGYERASIAI
jgi:hypothetical protein